MSVSATGADAAVPPRVFIVDVIDALPGKAGAVRDAYLAEYAPAAQERGMELISDWISPPIALTAHVQRLTFAWAVAGTEGWWRQRLGAAFDPTVRPFWAKIDGMIERRERTCHEEAARHV